MNPPLPRVLHNLDSIHPRHSHNRREGQEYFALCVGPNTGKRAIDRNAFAVSRIKAAVMAGMGFIDTISTPAGMWTALNQIHAPKEILPMIESEHDNLTPQNGRACPARTREILGAIVKGGESHPDETRQ